MTAPQIVPETDGTYSVSRRPGSKVGPFATRADALAWIDANTGEAVTR